MPGAPGMPNKAVGMPNGAPRMPNGEAPGTEAGAAGLPLGEFALLDIDRRRRTGVPEVVFGEGKTSEQIFALLAELRARDPEAPALATRCPADVLDGAATRFPGDAVHADQVAGTVAVGALPPARGNVLVVTAGTTDLKVAPGMCGDAGRAGRPRGCPRRRGRGRARNRRIRAGLASAAMLTASVTPHGRQRRPAGGCVARPLGRTPRDGGRGHAESASVSVHMGAASKKPVSSRAWRVRSASGRSRSSNGTASTARCTTVAAIPESTSGI